jgi:hypothetical protein
MSFGAYSYAESPSAVCGKLFHFSAAIESYLIWLAIIGVIKKRFRLLSPELSSSCI